MFEMGQGAVAGCHRLQQVFDSRKADIISLYDYFQGLTDVVLRYVHISTCVEFDVGR